MTFTVTKEADFDHCSFVFRENITSAMYIYYEEVNRDMPGFKNWPHHKPMNIEAPASVSEADQFIWRLPLKERAPNSYIKHYQSNKVEKGTQVQVTVQYPFHFRYQPVQRTSSFKEVTLEDPEVFVDYRDAYLCLFSSSKDAPVINQVTELNKPQKLSVQVPVGRIEHRWAVTAMTISITFCSMSIILKQLWRKASEPIKLD